MIDREQTFKVKFDTAASCFGVKPEQIVSLKLRETVSSSHDYRHLLDALGEEAELKPSVIEGNLQGRGYLLWQGKSKIIIVEHTTGLEILYIAGSIASLVGLIPTVLQCWTSIHSFHDGLAEHDFRSIEIRRLDIDGSLIENRIETLTGALYTPLSVINSAICVAAEVIDEDIESIKDEVRGLRVRLAVLEKKLLKADGKP